MNRRRRTRLLVVQNAPRWLARAGPSELVTAVIADVESHLVGNECLLGSRKTDFLHHSDRALLEVGDHRDIGACAPGRVEDGDCHHEHGGLAEGQGNFHNFFQKLMLRSTAPGDLVYCDHTILSCKYQVLPLRTSIPFTSF